MGSGWASVLKTHWSKEISSSSLNNKYKYCKERTKNEILGSLIEKKKRISFFSMYICRNDLQLLQLQCIRLEMKLANFFLTKAKRFSQQLSIKLRGIKKWKDSRKVCGNNFLKVNNEGTRLKMLFRSKYLNIIVR